MAASRAGMRPGRMSTSNALVTLGMGDESALRPEVSMRFAQRDNLAKRGAGGDRRSGDANPLPRPEQQFRVGRRHRAW